MSDFSHDIAYVKELEAENERLRAALNFVNDLANEAYGDLNKSVAMEVVLRHIIRKTNDALEQSAAPEEK